ncbi:family 78 glycoside hydrolase catalytic domain [Microbacterium betulae]|uniref:alpha-L-rhamnosidase n=1 Tax=Microbacterium betulae TaxID=2981139 RepID=A0AA97FMU8_9MICO|nr:family 78 glycoside hydrolase catalytic domain [Microbacterium sp. AB]WOF24307.1 family 78 glycoside hydrolase catalytic domain [Microbacterium sp. AB]
MSHPARSHVVELRTGGRGAPRFAGSAEPALTWRVESEAEGWSQGSATIEARRGGILERHVVQGAQSASVGWPFAPLRAYETAEVRVVVTGADGVELEPGAWTAVEAGPLRPEDWTAAFVAAAADDSAGAPAPPSARDGATEERVRDALTAGGPDRLVSRFRRELPVSRRVARALLSYTAHGVVEFRIDDEPVSDELLAPGWTAYRDRLLFSTVDVTAALSPGEHMLGAWVGPGWYAEYFGFDGDFFRTWTGPRALSAQLRIEYADGGVETIVTDAEWSATIDGPIRFASVYQGERYDARLEDDGLAVGGTLTGSAPVVVLEADPGRLRPAALPPVRVTETRAVVDVVESATGETILDVGQNLVGRLRVRVKGAAGTTISLRHAEVLEHDELGIRPLRFAAAADTYTLAGAGVEEWAPRFTFHGFRYAQITGVEPGAVEVVAEVLHTDLVRTGWLSTDVPEIDRLHANVVWGARGNFVSIPTDCPQRDERLGWTGDLQVFAPTAGYLFDTQAFLSSWLEDVAADQARIGGIGPLYSPLIDQRLFAPAPMAAWSDVTTVVPSVLRRQFADRGVIERQYPSMKAWVDVVRGESVDGLWEKGMQLADWLDPTAPPDRPAEARTDPYLVATAYSFRSATLVAEAAALLGKDEDAAEYAAVAAGVRAAFNRAYVTPAGRMMSDSQTAYAVAIVFGLLPDELVAPAGARLAAIVERGGHRIGTGFVGTPIVSDALTISGHRATAQRMLQTDELPSWLYPVSMGATTIWERWDSMLPDGTINPGEMTSFNHYALGAVADWLHRDVGGIAPLEPGYRRILVRPRAGLVSRAEARHDSVFGPIRVEWTAADPALGEHSPLEATVVVPPNTTAVVDLPGREPVEVGSGTHRFAP